MLIPSYGFVGEESEKGVWPQKAKIARAHIRSLQPALA